MLKAGMRRTRKWTLKGQIQRRPHLKTVCTLVGAVEETEERGLKRRWEEGPEEDDAQGGAAYEYLVNADTGGEDYEYPADERVEFLPILAWTVLVFTLGVAVGRCTKR